MKKLLTTLCLCASVVSAMSQLTFTDIPLLANTAPRWTFSSIPNLWFWGDSDNARLPGADFTNDAPMTYIQDKSGNNITNWTNGRWSWQTNGAGLTSTNVWLRTTNESPLFLHSTSIVLSNPWTALIVFRANSKGGVNGNSLLGSVEAESRGIYVDLQDDNLFTLRDANGTPGATNAYNYGRVLLVSHIQSNSVTMLRTNGASYTNFTLSAPPLGIYDWKPRIFGHVYNGSYWMKGDYFRLLIWTNKILSASELLQAETQCKLDYGIQ